MKRRLLFVVAMLAPCVIITASQAADWPGFRGPTGTGVSDKVDLPAKWTADNFLWKVKLPGPGTATPITSGDKVFVTCYNGYGTTLNKALNIANPLALDKAAGGKEEKGGAKGEGAKGAGFDPTQLQKLMEKFGKGEKFDPAAMQKLMQGFSKDGKFDAGAMQKLMELFGKGGFGNAGDQKNLRLMVLCFDAKTGKQLWQREVEPKLPEASASGFVSDHGFASSTPVTDGQRVYVFFGKTGVLAFDFDGKKLWQADVGSNVHINGTASSLLLYKDLVIVNAGVESGALLALNKATGKEVWRAKDIAVNWTSPVVVQTKDNKYEVVLAQSTKITGWDPLTGKELWHVVGAASDPLLAAFGSYSTTFSTPVARDGILYVTESGGLAGQPATVAIHSGGRGDVTKSHVMWRQKGGTRFTCPVVSGDFVFCIDGYAVCLRAESGKVVYKERLTDPNQYPSPVIAGDKIVVPTRFDGLYVLAAGDKFQALAHNVFQGDDSGFNASPAISNGQLFMRSNAYLYCIGKKVVR